MPDASYLQTSFLGGEWSPLMQGRLDRQDYRSGMNVCRNGFPVEEGAWTRRPGTRTIGPTRGGVPGVLRRFDFSAAHPYLLELTPGHLRFIANTSHVVDATTKQYIVSASAATPTVVQTQSAHGLTTGDIVIAQLEPGQPAAVGVAPLLGRQLRVTVTDSTHYSVVDAVTGTAINGSLISMTAVVFASKVVDFATVFTAKDLAGLRTAQGQTATNQINLLLLTAAHQPYTVQATAVESGTVQATFSFAAATFQDGPYYDVPKDASTITPSATSGSVTLTLAPNGGSAAFVATDVGRHVRLFSEPAAWSAGTAYAVGDQVKYSGSYYQAIKANTGKDPSVDVTNWGVATTAAGWMWAVITAYTDATHVTATLNAVPTVGGQPGITALPRTGACTYRMGLYSDTSGWPQVGTYHEGRFWLSGVQGNRVDASVSNDPFNFAPTASDGTVADANAIAAVFNSPDVNPVFWMKPDTLGIIVGTQAGEWLISASATNDPITPTSIQAHQKTAFGAANQEAIRAGLTILYVQRYTKKVLEYVTTDFRGPAARNLSSSGKHLTTAGIAEIAYQREKVPVVWARTNDGKLLGCTYRRESSYASDPPDFAGWHRHDLGSGQTVLSIQAGPNYDGTIDALSMVVQDPVTGYCYCSVLTDVFDVDCQIGDSLFVDAAATPSMGEIIAGTPNVMRLYSLHALAGKSVDVMIGGVDCGSLNVAADGHLDVSVDAAGSLLTSAYLASLSSSNNFRGLGLSILGTTVTVVPQVSTPLTGLLSFDQTVVAMTTGGAWTTNWALKRVYGWTGTKAAVWDLSTGALVFSTTTIPNGGSSIGALKWAEDGLLYGVGAAGNSTTLYKINPATLTQTSSFGAGGSQFNSDATHISFPADVDTIVAGSSHYWLQSQSFAGGEVALFNLDSMSFISAYTPGETKNNVCRGKAIGSFGVGVVAGLRTGAFQLYRLLISPAASAAFPPAILTAGKVKAEDMGWTHFTACFGIVCDETDGNIIFQVSQGASLNAWSSATTYALDACVTFGGHDFKSLSAGNINHSPTLGGNTFWQDMGVSQTTGFALVKANLLTGKILWNVQFGSGQPGLANFNDTQIKSGLLMYNDTASNANGASHRWVYSINTLTGTFTRADVLLVAPSYQTYDDQTGTFILQGNWTVSAGSPVNLGTTPTSGNTLFWYGATTSWPQLSTPAAPTAAGSGVPCAIGYGYLSQGQILRPIHPQEAGSANGPALGKTRRTHMISALLQQAQGFKVGTEFAKLHMAELKSKGGSTFALTSLYSDIYQDSLEDDYSFDSMVCWQVDRPYPATVCALGPFLHTQDR